MPKRLPRLVGSFHLIGVACGALALWLMLSALALASPLIGLYGGKPFIHFGYVDPGGPPVVVTGGTQFLVFSPQNTWFLSVQAEGDLVNSEDPRAHIPVSRLSWAIHDGSPPTWTPFAPGVQQVVHGPADPTGGEGETIQLDYRFTPSWDDPPLSGQYATDIHFTVSPNLDLFQSWVYPTPFRPDGMELLTIGYWLPGSGPKQLEVVITDSLGEEIARLRTNQLGGDWQHVEWNGRTFHGDFVPPGIYHYQVLLLPQREPIAAGMIQIAYGHALGNSTLKGEISAKDTQSPLEGAQVVLYTRERRQVAAVRTGADGMYQIGSLPVGKYYLEASSPGYVSTQSEVFQLDGYEDFRVDLALLPNRTLDLDLQLQPSAAAVGDLVQAVLYVTNSGTRDLLGSVVELALPHGLSYVAGKKDAGRLESSNDEAGNLVIRWETGFLARGKTRQAEIWLLVGLDVPYGGTKLSAQATGYAKGAASVTPRVERKLHVESGPFLATTPQHVVDCHLILPFGEKGTMEVHIQPDKAILGPGLPFAKRDVDKRRQRSSLVSVAEPLPLDTGVIAPHRLRIRLEKDDWAVEGGKWHHNIDFSPFPQETVAFQGVQIGSRLDQIATLRIFYGLPLAWPHVALYPADNTSGPFELPKAPSLAGRVDVAILSWDPVKNAWQEEAPVLFRVDHGQGTVTLGRAVSTYNAQGRQQYVLVAYTQNEMGFDVAWKEAGLSFAGDDWHLYAGYLETDLLGKHKMATVLGKARGPEFRLQGSLRTVLGYRDKVLNPIDTTASDAEKTDAYFPALSKSRDSHIDWDRGLAWQLTAALEARPGLWLAGGWEGAGRGFVDLWGVTALQDWEAAKIPSEGKEELDGMVLRVREVLGQQSRIHRGADGFLSPSDRRRAAAIGAELELKGGWALGSLASRTKIMPAQGDKAQMGPMETIQGWEQRLIYRGIGLPRWSLGYGQRMADKQSSVQKTHYALMEVDGYLADLEWGARLEISQEIGQSGKQDSLPWSNPLVATGELKAAYEHGRVRPYLHGRQGVFHPGLGEKSSPGQEEWTIGVEGELSEAFSLRLAHTRRRDAYGPANRGDQGLGDLERSQNRDTLSIGAQYMMGEKGRLEGTYEWPTGPKASSNQVAWRGSLELERELSPNAFLRLGWVRWQDTLISPVREPWDRINLELALGDASQMLSTTKLNLAAHLGKGQILGWELAGEGKWEFARVWEIWVHAAQKQVVNGEIGSFTTQQGILRFSRALSDRFAAFTQVGGWRQTGRNERGYSLGLSYRMAPGVALAVGHTWSNQRHRTKEGFLSVKPGIFLQIQYR